MSLKLFTPTTATTLTTTTITTTTTTTTVGRVAETVPGSNPGGMRFSARSDRPWGPPSLLCNGYWVFSGGKVRPGRAADQSPPSSAVVMEEWSYNSTHSLGHNRACNGDTSLYQRTSSQSKRPCGLRRRFAASRQLRLWVRITPGARMSVVSVVCCQVEVSATRWSPVQSSLTNYGASLGVI